MPNIKSAKKKMRQDVKRTKKNATYKKAVHSTLKNIEKGKVEAKDIQKAYSVIDKAVKKKIMHKNKAARLKSKISRSKATK